MNYKKEIDKKLTELKERKAILEKDYDEILPIFVKQNRNAENHESYTRMLNVTHAKIMELDGQINLLREIKKKAQ